MLSLGNRPRARGFSLMEAIFASFLLLTAVALATFLVSTSMRASTNNERKIVASMVAESAMEEIRASSNEHYSSLSGLYDGKVWDYPEFEGYSITSRVAWEPLNVPCSSLESQYVESAAFPSPSRTVFTQSLWKVQVEVSWSGSPLDRVRLLSHIADWNPVGHLTLHVTPGGGELPKDGEMEFSAEARNNGVVLKDLVLSWYVEPLDGYGTIVNVSRDGSRCRFKNVYRNYDGSYTHAPGRCNVVVRATYQGRESESRIVVNCLP